MRLTVHDVVGRTINRVERRIRQRADVICTSATAACAICLVCVILHGNRGRVNSAVAAPSPAGCSSHHVVFDTSCADVMHVMPKTSVEHRVSRLHARKSDISP